MNHANPEIEEVHAIIYGRVHGVCFRMTTKKFALELGIFGTVKNLPDGTVEIFAQGSRKQLTNLLDQLSGQEGPGAVSSIKKSFTFPNKLFSDFKII